MRFQTRSAGTDTESVNGGKLGCKLLGFRFRLREGGLDLGNEIWNLWQSRFGWQFVTRERAV